MLVNSKQQTSNLSWGHGNSQQPARSVGSRADFSGAINRPLEAIDRTRKIRNWEPQAFNAFRFWMTAPAPPRGPIAGCRNLSTYPKVCARSAIPAPVQNNAPASLPRGGRAACVLVKIGLTQSEDGGHDEIDSNADQRRQSECESGANRKANVDKPVLIPGLRALSTDLAVLSSVSV